MTALWIAIAFAVGASFGAFLLAAIMLALAVNKRGDQLAANLSAEAQQ
jgi:hypothetical protein